jgi:hypothetical protein
MCAQLSWNLKNCFPELQINKPRLKKITYISDLNTLWITTYFDTTYFQQCFHVNVLVILISTWLLPILNCSSVSAYSASAKVFFYVRFAVWSFRLIFSQFFCLFGFGVGIEARASRMLGKYFTIEPHPSPSQWIFKTLKRLVWNTNFNIELVQVMHSSSLIRESWSKEK